MASIETLHDLKNPRTRDFFIHSWAEVFLYCLLAGITVILLNYGRIINRLSGNYIGAPQNLKANFSTFSAGFSNAFSSALGGRLGQIILWSFIGGLVYLAIWLIRNVFNSFENDAISYHYLHPTAYSRAGYLESTISVKLFLLALVLVLAGYLYLAITSILPSVAALAGSAAYNFKVSTSPLYILFSIVGTAFVIYITIVLFKLISHLWKLL